MESIISRNIIDISNEKKSVYRITKAGTFSFFAKNRVGEITFDIVAQNAHIDVRFLFEGNTSDHFSIHTKQIHSAPNSSSKLVIKSVLQNDASIDHIGTIRIEPSAQQTNASLESRHLLMNASTVANIQPHLEILANDVQCSHAVTTSPPNPDLVFFLQSRGIDVESARQLIASGFLDT